jgi:hypothetical protein
MRRPSLRDPKTGRFLKRPAPDRLPDAVVQRLRCIHVRLTPLANVLEALAPIVDLETGEEIRL